jgi:hypothetical protein
MQWSALGWVKLDFQQDRSLGASPNHQRSRSDLQEGRGLIYLGGRSVGHCPGAPDKWQQDVHGDIAWRPDRRRGFRLRFLRKVKRVGWRDSKLFPGAQGKTRVKRKPQ